ncbi:nucleotide-binding protein [Labilibacter marinus]|uniref:nucleotide-binding protein n=1 Tax=Labilibacter marinus TaxID=1477105 RepID=UPI00094FE42A|nr:ATP-binding protein [Labilibacter marinus]
MAYNIAIASGKGGTGKTTVAVGIYQLLLNKYNYTVQLVDCDVEEPNDVIFFEGIDKVWQEDAVQMIPTINTDNCDFCRKCADYCEYNAITLIPSTQFAEINTSLCHSCGACLVACSNNAIGEAPHKIGEIAQFKGHNGELVQEGKLKVGSPMQTLLIKQLKKSVLLNSEINIYDAPPGTSCSVVESTIDADYVLLVTEPTPFGLHDLKLAVNLMDDLKKDFGVIINKAGLGSDNIYQFIRDNNVDLVGEIPFSKSMASYYAVGDLSNKWPIHVEQSINNIAEKLHSKVTLHERNYHT